VPGGGTLGAGLTTVRPDPGRFGAIRLKFSKPPGAHLIQTPMHRIDSNLGRLM